MQYKYKEKRRFSQTALPVTNLITNQINAYENFICLS